MNSKENVFVHVSGKKQAKQYKAILKGLGEHVSHWTFCKKIDNDLHFDEQGWCLDELPEEKKEVTIKELIELLFSKKEEPKQKEVEIISHKSGNRFKITIDKVYVVDSSIGLTDLDIDVLYQATRTIRR